MSRSIDGIVIGTRPNPSPTGDTQRLNVHPTARPGAARTFAQKQFSLKYSSQPHIKKTWKERLQLPFIVIAGMLAGFAIQNPLLGQVLIVGYGIFAFIYRIPSRITFMGALATILIMFGLMATNGDAATSHTLAIYTFLLLVVGVITLNREVKQEGGRIYSRRYR
ncbi:MAG TPA: hypothetical protein VFB59_01385 [Candidatus Saccharimonadales bacterium]|nr:hypothetical protein [Candidatus Saccharimonadales bacterium]